MRFSDWRSAVCSSDLKTVPIGSSTGLTLQRRRVNGESRLELNGFDPRSLPSPKAHGCFTEIIQFKTRMFIPVSRAADIVAALRSEEGRVGKECVSTCRSRGAACN